MGLDLKTLLRAGKGRYALERVRFVGNSGGTGLGTLNIEGTGEGSNGGDEQHDSKDISSDEDENDEDEKQDADADENQSDEDDSDSTEDSDWAQCMANVARRASRGDLFVKLYKGGLMTRLNSYFDMRGLTFRNPDRIADDPPTDF